MDENSELDDSIGASSSIREDLNQFITDIKVSIEGNGLCTSVHYKPTDSHSHLFIHLHVHHMSRIPFLIFSFLIGHLRLCSNDSEFSLKSRLYCFCCSSRPS